MSKIENKILYGPPQAPVQYQGYFVYRLLELIRTELRETGDRDWLVDASAESSVRLSHIEVVTRAVGAGFSSLGLSPGQSLHLACNSRLDFYWPVFGAWICGARVSVGDPGLSVELIRGQMEDTRAGIVVTTAEAAPKFVQANRLLKESFRVRHILVIDRDPWEDLPLETSSFRALYNNEMIKCPPVSSLPPWDPDEEAVIHWSSGTSGKPKGIVHSQHYLHTMMKPSVLPAGTLSICSNIMFHGGAFLLPLDGGIMNRFICYFITEESFTPSLALDMIAKYRPMFYMCGTNHALAVAGQAREGRDVSSLKVLMPAGGSLHQSIVSRLKLVFPELSMVYQFYGSTEIAGVSSSLDVSSLGSPLPGAQVYIRDRATGGRLGPNDEGEIMAKTGTMMKGYLNRYKESQEYLDGDGFAHMGDIGYYDNQGKLYYVDRIKELLKVSNYWFGPGEVDTVLEEMPQVLEACVWGSYDKETGDDRISAALVLSEVGALSESDVRTHIANNLQQQKQLTGKIYFVDSIPHNPQGKKLRRLLKEKYSQK